MSDDRHHGCGLSRRELERELAWILRTIPGEPQALAKLLAQAIVTLIDKNNAAIAKRDGHGDDHKPGAP